MSQLLNRLRQARQSEDLHAMSLAAREINEAAPDLGGSWGEVAALALEAGDVIAALRAADHLTKARPDHADSWLWLASVQAQGGDPGAALKTLQPLYDADSRNADLNRRLGWLLLEIGAADKAEQAFRLALASDEHDVFAWEGLAQARRFAPGDDDLARMEQARVGLTEDFPADQRGVLSYAIAKAYEDMGELDIAARRVAEGAAFYRASAPFDTDTHEALVAHTLDVFGESLKGRGEAAGARDERPVFIIAPPGAGASWLARVLGADEKAAALPRTNGLFWMAGAALGDHSLQLLSGALDQSGEDNPLTVIGNNYLAYAGEWAGEAERIIDPAALNELSGGAIGFALPHARFIRLVRDRRDLAWSVFRRRFRKARHWTYHPDDIARILAAHDRLCARWQALFGERVLTLSYEDVAADPAGAAREAARFAGLDAEAAAERAAAAGDALAADPPGQAARIGARFAVIEAALARAGLVETVDADAT